MCCVGFLLLNTKENGELVAHKHFDRKLRFNNERQENVYKVTGINFSDNSAVCLKCYRSVESVLKSEQKNNNMKEQIWSMARTVLQLLSPKRKTITKRMLRSPVISLSAKKEKALNIENVKYKPVHILPFKEITNTGVTDNQKVCADHWNFKILMPIKVKLR